MTEVLSWIVEVGYVDPKDGSRGDYASINIECASAATVGDAAMMAVEMCVNDDPELSFFVEKIHEWTALDELQEARDDNADSMNEWELQ